MFNIGTVIEHLWIAGIGLIIGIAIGNFVGNLLEKLILRIQPSNTSRKIISYLIPWRTILVGLAALNLFPVLPLRLLHAGWKLGVFNTAYIIFLCVLALKIQTSSHKDKELSPRRIIVSFYRSLIVIAPVLLIYYGFMGGGGVGFVLYQSIILSKPVVNTGILLAGIILMLDLLSGVVQYYLDSRVGSVPILDKFCYEE